MNILTIDLEEWFHVVFDGDPASWKNEEIRVLTNTDFILDTLLSARIKATFLTVGWIARQYPELIRKIRQAGFEIGSHSDVHKVAHQLTIAEFREDVKRSIESLEYITGEKVRIFRAPCFSITNNIAHYMETLIENGIEIDTSICRCVTKHGGYKNFPADKPCLIKMQDQQIKEFPIHTFALFNKPFIYSGGGYFRLLPFYVIKSIFKHEPYNMSYFHPRDFDTELQPDIQLSYAANFKRNIGLGTSRKKFKSLISSFSFLDIDASNQLIDWNNAPVVSL